MDVAVARFVSTLQRVRLDVLLRVLPRVVRRHQNRPPEHEDCKEEPALVLEELQVEEAVAPEHSNHGQVVNNLDDAERVHVRHIDLQQVVIFDVHLLVVHLLVRHERSI